MARKSVRRKPYRSVKSKKTNAKRMAMNYQVLSKYK